MSSHAHSAVTKMVSGQNFPENFVFLGIILNAAILSYFSFPMPLLLVLMTVTGIYCVKTQPFVRK